MRKLSIRLLPLLALPLFFSCKKGSGNSSASIVGNYKFVSVSANTSSTVEAIVAPGDDEKDVSLSSYTSTNNAGTVAISSTTMTISNMSYDINTTAMDYSYTNGVLQDTLSSPFQFSLPSYNGTATYRIIGADSIAMDAGSFVTAGSTNTSQPAGGRFKWSGNTLSLIFKVNQTTNQNLNGVSATQTDVVQETVTLQKM